MSVEISLRKDSRFPPVNKNDKFHVDLIATKTKILTNVYLLSSGDLGDLFRNSSPSSRNLNWRSINNCDTGMVRAKQVQILDAYPAQFPPLFPSPDLRINADTYRRLIFAVTIYSMCVSKAIAISR